MDFYTGPIFILTAMGIAVVYPLFMSLTHQVNGGVRLVRNNLRVLTISGGLGVLGLWLNAVNFQLQIAAVVWLVVVLSITAYYWNSEAVNPYLILVPTAFGIIVLYRIYYHLVQTIPLWPAVTMGVVSSCLLSGSIFLLVVKPLAAGKRAEQIRFMERPLMILLFLLAFRLVRTVMVMFLGMVEDPYVGDTLLYEFIFANDRDLFIAATELGIVLPLVGYGLFRAQIHHALSSGKLNLLRTSAIGMWCGEWLVKFLLFQYGMAF